jgi:hypothetical protein
MRVVLASNSRVPDEDDATVAGSENFCKVAGWLLDRQSEIPMKGSFLFMKDDFQLDFPLFPGTKPGSAPSASLLVVGNILSDLIVAMIDPRVKFN